MAIFSSWIGRQRSHGGLSPILKMNRFQPSSTSLIIDRKACGFFSKKHGGAPHWTRPDLPPTPVAPPSPDSVRPPLSAVSIRRATKLRKLRGLKTKKNERKPFLGPPKECLFVFFLGGGLLHHKTNQTTSVWMCWLNCLVKAICSSRFSCLRRVWWHGILLAENARGPH